MSIDIMRNSCLRLLLWFVYTLETGLQITGYVQNWEKIGKAWVGPYLTCFAMEMQHVIFYAHVHACSPSYADEE